MSVEPETAPAGSNRVLVVGIYLADEKNTIEHVVMTLDQSVDWKIDQRWIAIGRETGSRRLAGITRERVKSFVPKFTLINRLLQGIPIADYAFIVVCDDDILLPPDFFDAYLSIVEKYDFALSQPARTHESHVDHAFVEQFDGLIARQTRFVEIGPLFCLRHDAARLLLPFDEQSPMGWGYDLVWPSVLETARLKLGIVDSVPVGHTVRKSVSHYDHATANDQMKCYLRARQHLSRQHAFFVVNAYA